jgi:hypothetical protein
MESGEFSIIDLKILLTEDYSKYSKYDHPQKLTSNGDKYYLNIQGFRFVNEKHEQFFYSKNIVKYDNQITQKQMIRKIFTNKRREQVLDKESVIKIKNQVEELKLVLNGYGITLESSSVLIMYDALSKEIKVKFLDFSYVPEPKNEVAYLGLDLFNKMLDEIVE